MFRAIGFLIILWGLSQFFTTSFAQLDSTARESLKTIEIAAVASQERLEERI